MDNSEAQALERVRDKSRWTIGWLMCAAASLLTVFRILLDWHTRDVLGKFEASVLLAFLLLLPLRILMLRKRQKPVHPGWVLGLGYVLLMLAVQTFGPLHR